jgi:hypothetical protein
MILDYDSCKNSKDCKVSKLIAYDGTHVAWDGVYPDNLDDDPTSGFNRQLHDAFTPQHICQITIGH